MIVAVYRLQLYVIPKILTELKIFQGGQGPPLSALMCCFFSHKPVATTFSPNMGRNKSRAVLPFFTQASGHNFQPFCGPVFKTRADSGPLWYVICDPLFFLSILYAGQRPRLSALLRAGTRAGVCCLCSHRPHRPQTVFENSIGLLCGACVLPVFWCAVTER